jgi:hypothetical protein
MKNSEPITPNPSACADEAADHARDPLADVPLPVGRTDRFTAQPGDIEFTVDSVEVVTHTAAAENSEDG